MWISNSSNAKEICVSKNLFVRGIVSDTHRPPTDGTKIEESEEKKDCRNRNGKWKEITLGLGLSALRKMTTGKQMRTQSHETGPCHQITPEIYRKEASHTQSACIWGTPFAFSLRYNRIPSTNWRKRRARRKTQTFLIGSFHFPFFFLSDDFYLYDYCYDYAFYVCSFPL